MTAADLEKAAGMARELADKLASDGNGAISQGELVQTAAILLVAEKLGLIEKQLKLIQP